MVEGQTRGGDGFTNLALVCNQQHVAVARDLIVRKDIGRKFQIRDKQPLLCPIASAILMQTLKARRDKLVEGCEVRLAEDLKNTSRSLERAGSICLHLRDELLHS